MRIQFIGATHEVTGSCTLLEVGGRNYLVDCGMEQGADIFENVPIPVNPGSIVLFHNAALHTPEALPEIIEYLLSEGYSIVPVSELLLQGEYEMDHTGRMCPAGNA